jgi:hypothetical protein
MGMFGSEGTACAQLFNHLLKDPADQFLCGPLLVACFSTEAPWAFYYACSLLLDTLLSVAIGVVLPLFCLLALLCPCCCNCGCCCSSPWDCVPPPWGVWPLPRLFAVLTSPHDCWLLFLASSHPQTDNVRRWTSCGGGGASGRPVTEPPGGHLCCHCHPCCRCHQLLFCSGSVLLLPNN